MKIGAYFLWQNTSDWGRYQSKDTSPQTKTDQELFDEELRLADLVEPLGFDSYWAIDHYITPYGMTGGALQHLTRFAGSTSRIDLGTMVVVLPWYDPLKVAHQISVLDNMLQGRQLTLGMGRGASRYEFDSFGIPMEEARGRFLESLDVLKLALTKEFFSYDGEFFKIPETSVRPKFRNPERLLDRMKMAWNSPDTLPIAANAGVGIFATGQKPFESYRKDVGAFNGIRAGRGWDPIQPTVTAKVACFESETEAWDLISKHSVEYMRSTYKHYGFGGTSNMGVTKGYEQYAALDKLEISDEEIIEKEAKPQAWGTPDQVFEKLKKVQEVTGANEIIVNFKFGTMSAETAERSMRLFAAEVLPRLQELPTPLDASLTGLVPAGE